MRVIAAVVDPGSCRYYRKGQSFLLGGFTPKGLCDSAYAVLSRDAQTMRYGGALPWEKDGRVLTRCPDPTGALWELRLPAESDLRRIRQDRKKRLAPQPEDQPTWEVPTCRAKEGDCPFALTALVELREQIESVIHQSHWENFLRQHAMGRILSHQRLKVALAACPNACTQPQIKDIGVIACVQPSRVTSECNACGKCETVCEEGAVTVEKNRARLHAPMCVGCGLCVSRCPESAIETEGLCFRILVGGKLGRHPAWARELRGRFAFYDVLPATSGLLSTIMKKIGPNERIADVAARIGVDELTKTAAEFVSIAGEDKRTEQGR